MLKKTVRIGSRKDVGSIYAEIKIDEGRLSICGVEGPLATGNARGGCGQILDHLTVDRYAPGWNAETLMRFHDIWERWHLNDMRAECEHQRKRGETWTSHPSAVCPDCGYTLGSAWLREELPSYVIDFLTGLPNTDQQPAWV